MSVRLKITLLHAVLFVLTGAALLAVTHLLVLRTIADPDDPLAQVLGSAQAPPDGPPGGSGPYTRSVSVTGLQVDDVMRSLLANSGLALAVMTVLSVAVGWLVAGRMLRPLRTMTAGVRDISATNLHRRLTLDGPADELKELGDTFDGLLSRLEASFNAQRQFVANASHELRTPLARQRVLGQVALADPAAGVDTLRAAHERILVAGALQERMIEALLTLTRSQAGLASREPVDLARLAASAVASRADETVTVETDLAPAVLAGHRHLAERLVVNLVDNALRYNQPQGWVRVTAATVDRRATLVVANSGPVVPTDAVDALFQPFHRLGDTRAARPGDGLGLGLSIVRAIADAHDATIDAAARPEGGLKISVTFP